MNELERLRRWKSEAIEVIAGWERCYEALPAHVRDDPTNLGRSMSDIVVEYLMTSDATALRNLEHRVERLERLAGLKQEDS